MKTFLSNLYKKIDGNKTIIFATLLAFFAEFGDRLVTFEYISQFGLDIIKYVLTGCATISGVHHISKGYLSSEKC